jgi:hypothetical protein
MDFDFKANEERSEIAKTKAGEEQRWQSPLWGMKAASLWITKSTQTTAGGGMRKLGYQVHSNWCWNARLIIMVYKSLKTKVQVVGERGQFCICIWRETNEWQMNGRGKKRKKRLGNCSVPTDSGLCIHITCHYRFQLQFSPLTEKMEHFWSQEVEPITWNLCGMVKQ